MEIKAEVRVAVHPDRVRRAITTPGELVSWCCDQAEVDGERYRLIGPTLPGGGMGGRLLKQSESELHFQWELAGVPSEVRITLADEEQTGNPPATFTRVSVVHSGIPSGAIGPVRWEQCTWECIWSLWLRQLRLWAERAEAPAPFRYEPSYPHLVQRQLVMEAPVAKVWRALVEPQLRERWLTVPLGEVLARQEERLIAFAWPPAYDQGQVTFRLEPVAADKTLVTIIEERDHATIDHHLGRHDYLVALYQETAQPLVRQTVWIKAAPERVWRYLGNQEGLRRWLSTNIRFEERIGGDVRFEAHGGKLAGQVTAYEPGVRLAFSWTELEVGWPEPAPLQFSLDLRPEGGGTRVILTHSGFERLPEAIRPREFAGYQRGWSKGAGLQRLKQITEEDAA